MKHNYLIIAFFLFLISCKNESSIESFEITEKVSEYELIYSDKNNVLGAITNIESIDSIIILKHAGDSYYFSFINKKNGDLIARFGKKGKGPDEYIQIGPGFTIKDSNLIFLDNTKKEINYAAIKDILNNSNNVFVKKEQFPYTINFRPFHLNSIGDKKIFIGAFTKGRFGILDSLNNIIDCSFDYPFDYKEVQGINKGIVFQSIIKSSNKQSKFALLTLISDIFEIYQVTDSDIERVYVSPFNNIPIIRKNNNSYYIDSNQSISGLLNMAVSDDLICFSYSTLNYTDARNIDKASNVILSFNWKGKKYKKYVLPFPINKFCIDKNHLYGVRYYNSEIQIYQFPL